MSDQKETFGSFLRRQRIALNKSMGEVARALGITVVYYSEVEGGRKKPFPERKVAFETLAEFLGVDVSRLRSLAEAQRQEFRVSLFNKSHETAQVAMLLARRLSDDDLTQEEVEGLKEVLERGEICTTK